MSQENRTELAKKFDELTLILAKLRRESGCDTSPKCPAQAAYPEEIAYHAAMQCIANRLARHKHFRDRDIFGEPAWDILLDLYVQDFRQKKVSIKSATIGSGVPATTALRWLSALEEMALISSYTAPGDQRRRFVRLTPEGYESMTKYLNEIARRPR